MIFEIKENRKSPTQVTHFSTNLCCD